MSALGEFLLMVRIVGKLPADQDDYCRATSCNLEAADDVQDTAGFTREAPGPGPDSARVPDRGEAKSKRRSDSRIRRCRDHANGWGDAPLPKSNGHKAIPTKQ